MTHVIGIDLASVTDFTAVSVLRRSSSLPRSYLCRYLERWREPYPVTVERVAKLANAPPLRDAVLAADATGVGQPVIDMLRAALPGRTVIGITITFGSQPTRGHTPLDCRCPKKVLVSNLQVLFGQKRLTYSRELPLMKALQDELAAFRVKITANANETFEHWRERDHDDLVLSLAMAAWVGEVLPGPLPAVRDMVLNDLPDEEEKKDQRKRLATLADDLPDVFADT